jgi:hypothetical protein
MTNSVIHELFECSGLTMSSEILLAAHSLAPESVLHPDVTLELGHEIEPMLERASTTVIAELVSEGYVRYSICQVGDEFVVRVPWVADFRINEHLNRVVCHPVKGGRSEVIPIIITGTIAAFLLAMSGRCVLHGSAVELGGAALAFVGVSGQGKSTMAAVFCAAGAKLVTDDVLPIEFGMDESGATAVYSLKSGHEIRLRDKAISLAQRFDEGVVRVTEDERHAVMPEGSLALRLPLLGIVLPRPDRERLDVSARKLSDGEASFALAQCERIEGWQSPSHFRQQFDDLGTLLSAVPVFEVSVPWGPPFLDDLAQQVVKACGFAATLPGL